MSGIKPTIFKELLEAKKRLSIFKKLNVSEIKIKRLERDVEELKIKVNQESFKTNRIFATIFYRSKISQAELAKLTGKEENNLSRWINSKAQLKFSDLEEILNALDVDVEIVIKNKSA